jgi:hypothetical protein
VLVKAAASKLKLNLILRHKSGQEPLGSWGADKILLKKNIVRKTAWLTMAEICTCDGGVGDIGV